MKIVTSLSFRGQCREAFEFYARILGGEITAALPYGDAPPDMPVDPQYKDWLMHCWLQVAALDSWRRDLAERLRAAVRSVDGPVLMIRVEKERVLFGRRGQRLRDTMPDTDWCVLVNRGPAKADPQRAIAVGNGRPRASAMACCESRKTASRW
ncbi:MAG: hypothetical protein Q8M32_07530 [Brevundimonas sp.]|nr:hypothetical protein [Brevundimonas sp.]